GLAWDRIPNERDGESRSNDWPTSLRCESYRRARIPFRFCDDGPTKRGTPWILVTGKQVWDMNCPRFANSTPGDPVVVERSASTNLASSEWSVLRVNHQSVSIAKINRCIDSLT